jgi:DnaJ-class molecular chaperone
MPEKTEVFVCPVCQGRGTLPEAFYLQTSTGATTGNTIIRVTCRSCSGKGYVVVRTVTEVAKEVE